MRSRRRRYEERLVAAGVALCRNQDEPRARRFRLRRAAEAGENAEYSDVSGEYPEADRGEHCEAEDDGH